MTQGIPVSLINAEIYDGSSNRLLGVANVDLPEIAMATTEVKGFGIAGKMDWPVKGNFDNMTLTAHWRAITSDGAQFLNQGRAHNISIRGVQEAYDAGDGIRGEQPIRVDARTHATKLALGKFEPGEQTDTELELMIDAMKVVIGGKTVVEIDKFNMVWLVNGEDMLSGVRDALGL